MLGKFLIAALALTATASAEPLVIRNGESWAFSIHNGQPVRAHRIAPSAAPKPGEIKASVNAMLGTSMTLTSNNSTGYTFRAELIGAPANAAKTRTCTLPPNRQPTLEYWPVKSAGVRLSDFKPTKADGNCP